MTFHLPKQSRLLPIFLSLLIPSCSDANFQGSSAIQRGPTPPPTDGKNGAMALSVRIQAGNKNLDLRANFAPKSKVKSKKGTSDPTGDYELVANSIVVENTDGLSNELAAALKAAQLTANVVKDNDQYLVTVNMNIKATTVQGESLAAQTLSLTQRSSDLTWSKDEGKTDKFGKLNFQSTTTGCRIESSGASPRSGVYSVVLTKPAACDFKLPTLKVGGGHKGLGQFAEVPIGSYWIRVGNQAHNFGITANYPDVLIDNGFILVQPDGKSYLLADAGAARAGGKTTAQIASDLSAQLGFGATQLLKPDAGSKADNFKNATTFKKGSVIAIYDDTPDMGGSLDISTLISAADTGGVNLSWTADVKTDVKPQVQK